MIPLLFFLLGFLLPQTHEIILWPHQAEDREEREGEPENAYPALLSSDTHIWRTGTCPFLHKRSGEFLDAPLWSPSHWAARDEVSFGFLQNAPGLLL